MKYVNTNTGSDSNNGSLSAPYKTITKALSVAAVRDTITIFDGKYNETLDISSISDLTIVGSGNVIIDGLNRDIDIVNFNSLANQINITKDNIHIKNITVINSPCMALRISGNNCVFENIYAYDNYLGFFIYGENNKFTNCKSMYNYDFAGIPQWHADNAGENADGFSISGSNNNFYYCESAYNSDDGFDGYGARGNNFEHCISHNNGVTLGSRNRDISAYRNLTYRGDGNGFKLGPGPASTETGKRRSADNTVSYCIAYNNASAEFDANGGTGNKLTNCKALNSSADLSSKRAYRLGDITNIQTGDEINTYYTNCLSYPNDSSFLTIVGNTIQIRNSWNDFSIVESDLESVDPTSEHFLHIPYGSRLNSIGIFDEGKEGGKMEVIDIIAYARSKYPKYANTTMYPDLGFIPDINFIHKEEYFVFQQLRNRPSKDSSLTTVAGQLEYTLPTNCTIENIVGNKITVTIGSNDYIFEFADYEEDISTGDYYRYGSADNKIELLRNNAAIDTTGYKLTIVYHPIPTEITSINQIPDLDVGCHNLLCYRLINRLAMTGENPDAAIANTWQAEYNKAFADLIKRFNANKTKTKTTTTIIEDVYGG